MYGSFSDGEQPAARIKDLAAIKALDGAIPMHSVTGVLARELYLYIQARCTSSPTEIITFLTVNYGVF